MTADVTVPSTGGVTADTANLIAAHGSLPSSGGTIRLDAGPYDLTADAVSFTKPVHLIGSGPSGPNAAFLSSYLNVGTRITCASPTGVAIAVNADGCTFEKIALFNTAPTTPTAGAGIRSASNGKSTRIVDCAVVGFWANVDIVQGYEWFIGRCQLHDPVKHGIRVRDVDLYDGGDGIIADCSMIAGPTHLLPEAMIQWESGGGMKVAGTKIVNRGTAKFQVGINYQVADAVGTSVSTVTGCSIENGDYGILFQQKGPANSGFFGLVTITGNEIVANAYAVGIAPAVPGHIRCVNIAHNAGSGQAGFVYVQNVDLVDVGTNTISSGPPLTIGAGVTNLHIEGLAYATSSRPSPAIMRPGSWIFDTTYSKPAYSNGSVWRDAAGNLWS